MILGMFIIYVASCVRALPEKSNDGKTADMARILEIKNVADAGDLVNIKSVAETVSSNQDVGSAELQQIAKLIDEKLEANARSLGAEQERDAAKEDRIEKFESMAKFTQFEAIKRLAEAAIILEERNQSTEKEVEDITRLAVARDLTPWTNRLVVKNASSMKRLSRDQISRVEEIERFAESEGYSGIRSVANAAKGVENARIFQTQDRYANEYKGPNQDQLARYQTISGWAQFHLNDLSSVMSSGRSTLRDEILRIREEADAQIVKIREIVSTAQRVKNAKLAEARGHEKNAADIAKLTQIEEGAKAFQEALSTNPGNVTLPNRLVELADDASLDSDIAEQVRIAEEAGNEAIRRRQRRMDAAMAAAGVATDLEHVEQFRCDTIYHGYEELVNVVYDYVIVENLARRLTYKPAPDAPRGPDRLHYPDPA